MVARLARPRRLPKSSQEMQNVATIKRQPSTYSFGGYSLLHHFIRLWVLALPLLTLTYRVYCSPDYCDGTPCIFLLATYGEGEPTGIPQPPNFRSLSRETSLIPRFSTTPSASSLPVLTGWIYSSSITRHIKYHIELTAKVVHPEKPKYVSADNATKFYDWITEEASEQCFVKTPFAGTHCLLL